MSSALGKFDSKDQKIIERWEKYTNKSFDTSHIPRLIILFVVIPIFIITIIWWSVNVGKPELSYGRNDILFLIALGSGLTLVFFGVGYFINRQLGLTYFDRKYDTENKPLLSDSSGSPEPNTPSIFDSDFKDVRNIEKLIKND